MSERPVGLLFDELLEELSIPGISTLSGRVLSRLRIFRDSHK